MLTTKIKIKMVPLNLDFFCLLVAVQGILVACAQINAKSASLTRVLLVNNSASRSALEEAASLSLDQPLNEPSQQQEVVRKQTNLSSSSLGYHQVSLASLNLHQQEPSLAKSVAAEPRPPDYKDPWTDLYLPRRKPSWLNVSSQYKITGTSIEEVQFMMPVEYLLRAAFDSPILLKTKLGIIEGVRSIKFNKHLYTFLSVPYAKPPVGELRFKAPQPVESWQGIMQATKWPPFCVQPSMTLASKSSPVHPLSQIMSEDCLYLNIWTPSLKFNKNYKRPVMLWIHGGAFQYGGISVDENDGSALALLGDVVVVTLNYRISAFGFLNANNPANGPNNVGILDQRLAMEWVQANIKQFGGDPQQVTLFGESAGGHSVGLHMISPGSQHLFKRAILQSGVPISLLRSYDMNADNKGGPTTEGIGSIMMAKRLKCYAEPDSVASSNNNSPVETLETTTISPNQTSTDAANVSTNAREEEEEDSGEPNTTPTYRPEIPLLSDTTLECMRNKSSLEILKAMGAPGNAGFFPTGNDLNGVFPNGPITDSFDPDNPKVGDQKDYLLGTNTDEGTFMLHYGMPSVFPSKEPPRVDNVEALKEILTRQIEQTSSISELKQVNKSTNEIQSASGENGGGAQAHLYKPLLRTSSSILESFMPKSPIRVLENGTVTGNTTVYSKEAEFGKNIASLITDIIFLCPARSLARTLSEHGRNVYFYLYTHRSSLSQYHSWLGVTHHDEVEFVFGRPLRMADVFSGKDIEVSQRIIKTWSHFAYTGQMLDQLGVSWPKYDADEGNYMILAHDRASIGQRYHDKVCNIYDTVISVHLTDN